MKCRRLLSLTLLPILFGASGCVTSTTETVRTVSDYKLLAFPITYAGGKDTDGIDTQATQEQIKKHNSRYECVVNNDCPAPRNDLASTSAKISDENTAEAPHWR